MSPAHRVGFLLRPEIVTAARVSLRPGSVQSTDEAVMRFFEVPLTKFMAAIARSTPPNETYWIIRVQRKSHHYGGSFVERSVRLELGA